MHLLEVAKELELLVLHLVLHHSHDFEQLQTSLEPFLLPVLEVVPGTRLNLSHMRSKFGEKDFLHKL